MPSNAHTESVRSRAKRPSISRGYTFSCATYSAWPLPCSGIRSSFMATPAANQLPAQRGGDHADQPEEEESDAVHVQPRAPPGRRLAVTQRHGIQQGETQHGGERGGEEATPDHRRNGERPAAELARLFSGRPAHQGRSPPRPSAAAGCPARARRPRVV